MLRGLSRERLVDADLGAEAGAKIGSPIIMPVERELAELTTDGDDEDNLEEGDHGLCVPEELEGRLGFQNLPAMNTLEWAADTTNFGPSAKSGAAALDSLRPDLGRRGALPRPYASKGIGVRPSTDGSGGGSASPLANVLQWMEVANVEDSAPSSSSCPASRVPSRVLCLGESNRSIHEHDLGPGLDIEQLRADLEFDDNRQFCLGIPSDEESRPRPPPYAAHVALMRWSDSDGAAPSKEDEDIPRVPHVADPKSRQSSSAREASALPLQCAPRSDGVVVDREEDEWMARKKLTGAIGKLVYYGEGSHPSADILSLRRTRHGRIKVTSLQPNGIAASLGVEVGDQLLSVDGEQPSEHRLADAIRTSLQSPTTLIFMGFAGKLQAEVRVRQPDEPKCGLPHFTDVARAAQNSRSGTCVEVCDTVVFQQSAASLLLQVDSGHHGPIQAIPPTRLQAPKGPPAALAPYSLPQPNLRSHRGKAAEEEGREPTAEASETRNDSARSPRSNNAEQAIVPVAPGHSRVYELQREEAKRIVMDALHAEALVAQLEGSEGNFRSMGAKSPGMIYPIHHA